jgi:hypothetical protein
VAAHDIQRSLKARASQRNWVLDPVDDPNKSVIVGALRDERISLFLYAGHGSAESLELRSLDGNGERVHWSDLRKAKWLSHPFIHFDCCDSGSVKNQRGGRFEGLSIISLEAGASAVVSSAVQIDDDAASDFSMAFYAALLHKEAKSVGEAVMIARRSIHERYGHPRHWSSSVLWGNPEARLAL